MIELLIIALCLISSTSFGQFTRQWEASYNTAGQSPDAAVKNVTDPQNNVFALIKTPSHGVVLKYSSSGELLWSFILNRETNTLIASPKDLQIDSDGNCYAVTKDNSSDLIFITKITSDGKKEWYQEHSQVGYKSDPIDAKVKLLMDTDANLYLVFHSYGELGVSKFSKHGALLWNKTYLNPTETEILTDARLAENKIVIIGHSIARTDPSIRRESLMLVYDTDGNFIWKDELVMNINVYTSGTYPILTDTSNGILYVAYAASNGTPDVINFLVRYTLSTGTSLGQTNLPSKQPLKKLVVGTNNKFYVVYDEDNYHLTATQYTLEGVPIKSVVHLAANSGIRQFIRDVLFDKTTNTLYTLIMKRTFNVGDTHHIIRFNDTNATIASNLVSSKSSFLAGGFSFDNNKQNFHIIGTFSNGIYYDDILNMKISVTNGLTAWETFYVTPNNLIHQPKAIAYDEQGNSYVAGEMQRLDGTLPNLDLHTYFGVIKYSPGGQELWTIKYAPENGAGTNVYKTSALAIAVNSKGETIVTGQILAGASTSLTANLYTIKISPDGKTISESILPGSNSQAAGIGVSIDDDDNAYVLLYNRNVHDSGGKLALIKYSPLGDVIWQKQLTDRASYYNSANRSTGYSGRPIMKIIDKSIYIGFNTYKYDNTYHWEPVEITKLDKQGNTVFSTSTFECQGNCSLFSIHTLLDFGVDKDGVMYFLAAGATEYSGAQLGDFVTYTVAMTSSSILWQNTRPVNKLVKDGNLAIGLNKDIFTITSSPENFEYSKINAVTGQLLWSKTEPVYKYEPLGHPCYAFVKTDGNPVFASSTATLNSPTDRDFFFSERNDNTGDQVHYETYDAGTAGFVSYDDYLVSFYRKPGENTFGVTGRISGNMSLGYGLSVQTIGTAAYSVTSLKAAFQVSKNRVFAKSVVTIADQSTGSPETWNWTFDGGVPSTFAGQIPPSITYSTPGHYDIKLTVTKGTKSNTSHIVDAIVVLEHPKAEFTFDKSKIAAGNSIIFTDQSTGSPQTWSWTFAGGDPAIFVGKNPPPIVYPAPGKYTVKLKVTTDDASDTREIVNAIDVTSTFNADFTFDNKKIIAGNTVSFADASVGNPTTWLWTFTGGVPSSFNGKNPPAIKYSTPGIYSAKLQISTVSATSDHEIVGGIEVLQKLKADFSFDDGPIFAGDEVQFSDKSQGICDQWVWSFQEGSPANATTQSATTIFHDPGVYNVKLTISSDIDSDSMTKQLDIKSITGVENKIEYHSIYPNPTTGWFEYLPSAPVTSLTLYNSFGETVKSLDPHHTQFNIADLPSGIYILKIQFGNILHGVKLVKK